MFTAIFLLIIGAILILFNINAIRKEENNFQKILHEKENNVGDYEVEIGRLRKEFAETLVEIQSQVLGLEEVINTKNYEEQEKSTVNENLFGKNEESNEGLDKDIEDNDDKNKVGTKAESDLEKTEDKEENVEIKVEANEEEDIKGKEDKNQQEKTKDIETPEFHENHKVNNVKVSEIQRLIEEGLGVDEIANKLKVNKGEVLLIKELYLK
ncbi:hypothetical protein RBU49_03600 [Clostridium sp. MB40-C1]|uniref:hypothetical protein n=1 Tax=Clostridium sp. MB40-C1 TaxID=3070996 RepID=UPI0027DFBF1C|nr:hypothetical protein [Clostridium sp. MB40-C1]WMJ81353.1 hypothetical protein RBU49_03600 [Clostridium sp. MB40-C1]